MAVHVWSAVASLVAIVAAALWFSFRPKQTGNLSTLPRVGFIPSFKFWILSKKPFDVRHAEVQEPLSLADQKVHLKTMPWGLPYLTGTSPVLTKELLDMSKFTKMNLHFNEQTFGAKLFGKNVAMVNGDEWQLHRSITRPAFARPLKMDVFITESHKVLSILQNHAVRSATASENHQVQAFEVYSLMQRLTLSVLGYGIFSYDFGSLPSLDSIPNVEDYSLMPAGPYVDMYNSLVTDVIVQPMYTFFPFLCQLPIPSIQNRWKKVNAFSDLLREMVEVRKDAVEKQKSEGKVRDPKTMDLLDMMVESAYEEGAKTKWTTENMMNNLFAFFVAGHDTTSNALSCALYNLAKHKDVQEKVRDEVNSVFGVPSSYDDALFIGSTDPITHSQLSRLQLLNAVIKETLRMYPSATQVVPRIAIDDLRLTIPLGSSSGGAVREIHVPKGTMANVDIWGMHHDPDVFEDPWDFKPERWLNSTAMGDENDQRASPWAPFGGGARICMGMQFSLVEQRVFLVMLLRAFEIELVAPDQKITLGNGALLLPIGLQLVFKPRSQVL